MKILNPNEILIKQINQKKTKQKLTCEAIFEMNTTEKLKKIERWEQKLLKMGGEKFFLKYHTLKGK